MTARSTRRLSKLAKYLVLPSGIVKTEGYTVIDVARGLGIEFDEWQKDLILAILGKRETGKFAAASSGVCLSLPRQVGKTFTIGSMIVILCALHPNTLVIWTAHRMRTAADTFKDMKALCAAGGVLEPLVAKISNATGREGIEFSNGSEIRFGAREQGFGRGFHHVSFTVFDEAQILTENALGDIVPTMNTAENGLVLYMGTPPEPNNPAEVFTNRRDQALDSLKPIEERKEEWANIDPPLWVEFAADKTLTPSDPVAWAEANPSFPKRTDAAAMRRMLSSLSADTFRREALGIWDDKPVSLNAINLDDWTTGTRETAPTGEDLITVALDMSADHSELTLAACWKQGNTAHVELVSSRSTLQDGSAWAVEWIARRWQRLAVVVLARNSPAMSLYQDLRAKHLSVLLMNAQDMARACGRFTDKISDHTLTHLSRDDQPALWDAVENVQRKPFGQFGQFVWDFKNSDVDISPLIACTLALEGAWLTKRRPNRVQKVV